MSEVVWERKMALGDGAHNVRSLIQLNVSSVQDRRRAVVIFNGVLLREDDLDIVPEEGDQVWIEWQKRIDAVTLLGELADGGSES